MSLLKYFQRNRRDDDRGDEMQQHLQHAIDHYISQGFAPDEARRKAAIRFGNVRAHREGVDDMHRLPLFDVLSRDLRYAIRVLRKTPAFTITAVATLAVVIGASTAVFSVADRVLLRALPYPDPDRLALVQINQPSSSGFGQQISVDGLMWETIRDRITTADRAVYVNGQGGVNFTMGSAAAFVKQQRVGAGFFRVLGVAPALGREFSPEEDVPAGPKVAVLSHRLWRSAFGSRASAVGETMTLRGESYAVIGVMPDGFLGTNDVDVWTPVRPSQKGEGGGTNFQSVLRLKPGATWAQLDAELRGISSRALFASMGIQDNQQVPWLSAQPMQKAMAESQREPLMMLIAAVAAVLLIACVNIASLLLARGGARRKELATRMALGSGRTAVIHQLMVESAVLAIAGGVIGLALGVTALAGLKALAGPVFAEWQQAAVDGRIVIGIGLVSLLASLVFGIVPAWQASRIDVQSGLRDSASRNVAGGSSHWLRRTLVVAEVALGVTLLVCAGLLIRSFAKLNGLQPGFDGNGLTTTSVSLQDARYVTGAKISALFENSLARLRQTPGVESATVSLELPYTRLLNMGARLDGEDKTRMANVSYVSSDYARTFHIPLKSGRDLSASDRDGAPLVALVNEAYAKLYSRDRDVIGRRMRMGGAEREIVGVIGSVQQRASFMAEGMVAGPITNQPAAFVPASQMSDSFFALVHQWFRPVWTVRSSNPDVAQSIRSAITAVDAQLPVAEVQTMTQVRAESLTLQRLLMTLVGLVAGAALLLAAMGLHGLIANSVAERTREFGIRMALGASAGQTIRSVTLSGLGLAVIGATIGGGLSVLAVRLVRSSLWGIEPGDPATYAGAMAFLIVVAAVSSLLPSLRLLRIDPAKTLRE